MILGDRFHQIECEFRNVTYNAAASHQNPRQGDTLDNNQKKTSKKVC
jgi:hypothetical protein